MFLSQGILRNEDDVEMAYEEFCYKQYRVDEHKSDGGFALPPPLHLIQPHLTSRCASQFKRSRASKSANAT